MLFSDQNDDIRGYVEQLFSPEDEVLSGWKEAAQTAGLPMIQVSPSVGQLLQVLVKAVGARRILEIGTLGGYSGTWMARGLPAGGKLISLEIEQKHADFARSIFDRAGVGDKVEIRLGPALDTLSRMTDEEPFDFVFIDADKGNYPHYLDRVLDGDMVRDGGIIAGDNALLGGFQGFIGDEAAQDANQRAMRTFNRKMATDPRLTSIIIPMREGVCVGVVKK
jgi:predicted O-methyltransferase YrrM